MADDGRGRMTEVEIRAAQAAYSERIGRVCKAVCEIMGPTAFAMVFVADPNDTSKGTLSVGNVPPPQQQALLRSVIRAYDESGPGPSVTELFSTSTGKSLSQGMVSDASGAPKTKNQA